MTTRISKFARNGVKEGPDINIGQSQEMTHINIDILGVTEVSWMGAGAVTSSDKTIIYSG